MKLLTVSEHYWTGSGGCLLATHLILELLKDEFDITVITGTERPKMIKGVDYIHIPFLNAQSKIQLWVTLLEQSKRLIKFVEKNDVIYIPRLAFPIIPIAKKYQKKVVVHSHDYQLLTHCSIAFSQNNFSLLKDLERSLLIGILENKGIHKAIFSPFLTPLNRLSRWWVNQVDEIICVSMEQYKIMTLALPMLANKFRMIYNPLPDIYLAEKKIEDSNFLYIGGEDYRKGFHILLRAAQKILKQNPKVRFQLTRSFNNINKQILERLNKRFKGGFNLLGHINYKGFSKLHSISRALLFPSIWEEPLPYAISEAMSYGTIPIASKVGGVPEIVKGSFAEKMLFEPYNVDEFAEKMRLLLTISNEQIIDIGHSLRETIIRKCNPEAVKKKLIEVFSSLY